MTISDLAKELYSERPTDVLYHYTSLDGMVGIVSSKSLWATDIRYFNDAAEMRHTAQLLRNEIAQRLERDNTNRKLLEQFREWLSDRLTDGHMVFVASFTANGNLLSQWRGYCPHGKGVSLGFHPDHVSKCADNQGFKVARCIYEVAQQQQLIGRVVDAIESLGNERGETNDSTKRHPTQSYYDVFGEVEGDLLHIAAVVKHPSFKEEQEWRAVSPIVINYAKTPIGYRTGSSMLIPYVGFSLRHLAGEGLDLLRLYVGPTKNMNLSMMSVSRYLAKNSVNPKNGVAYCQIPYRE